MLDIVNNFSSRKFMQRVFIPLECRCQRNDSRDNTNPQKFDQSSINEEVPRLFSALSGAISVMSD